MMNWQDFKLSEIAVLNQDSINKEYSHKVIKYLDTSSVTMGQISALQVIELASAPSRAKRLVKPKSIVYSTVRPIQRHYGFIEQPDKNMVVSTGFTVIDVDESLADPKFIYYWLTKDSTVEFLETLASSSTSAYPSIRPSDLGNLEISLPPLPVQKKISEILSSLDDKIELNNQINENLEALAQAIFKHWFIDFEFPDGNGNPYKSSGGKMVESELGLIPEGWEECVFKEEFLVNMGQSPKGETYNSSGEGVPFFQGRSDFGFRFPSLRTFTTSPKKMAVKFETLVSVRAPVGDINMAFFDCCIGRGLGAISHPEKLNSYTYYKLLSMKEKLKSFDNEGTVFGSINKDTLSNIRLIKPLTGVANSFNEYIQPLDMLIAINTEEVESLKNLRDGLLPRFMSGRIEI